MLRMCFLALWVMALAYVPDNLSGQTVCSASRVPSLNDMFQNTTGWTGGDADYSIDMGNGRVLWLFGDSWIGQIVNGKHVDAELVHNAIAIQEADDSGKAKLEFYWQHGEKPGAFFQPGTGWFWPLHGFRTSRGVFIFLYAVDKTDDSSVFGFKPIGSCLAHIFNPDDPVVSWQIKYYSLPFFRCTAKREVLFGASVIRADGWTYIYGTDDCKYTHHHKRSVLVARVKDEHFLDFHKWSFWNGSQWKKHFISARPLFFEGAKEFSVSWLAGIDRYVAMYTNLGLSPAIKARFSSRPEGPFSESVTVYECPENDRKKGVFTYAAKGHPWMSLRSDELILSYTTNCTDFFQLAADASLYWPVFVRVRFKR